MWLRGMRQLFAAPGKALLNGVTNASKTFVQGHELACFGGYEQRNHILDDHHPSLSPFRLARGLPETSSKYCSVDGLYLRQWLFPLDDCDSFGHT